MSRLRDVRIGVIVPAWNEEPVIGDVVRQIHKKFARAGCNFEVVVVDDGSTDRTAAEAHKASATVISHMLNQGQGGAISTALKYAVRRNFDYIVTVDADGQHDPADALSCLKKAVATDADFLIGSRLINASGMSTTKIMGNRGLSIITWLLFGVNVTDSQSGLRVLSRAAFKKLKWKSAGYEFCSEMLWRARQQKIQIVEHPIRAIYTEHSTSATRTAGQNNWNGISILKNLLRHRITEVFD